MPLTESGKKIRREMRKEYGKKKGDQVFYSKENKSAKFKKLVTGKKSMLVKAQWILDRLNKLPDASKLKFIKALLIDTTTPIEKSGGNVVYMVHEVNPETGEYENPVILASFPSVEQAKAACMDSYANPTSSMSADLDSFRAN